MTLKNRLWILLSFCIVSASSACVCSYWTPYDEVEDRLKIYPFIAAGKALKVKSTKKGTITTLELLKVYKGSEGVKMVKVYQDRSDCSLHFSIGHEYLVYCYMDGKHFFTDQCTLTKPLQHAAKDLELLNKD